MEVVLGGSGRPVCVEARAPPGVASRIDDVRFVAVEAAKPILTKATRVVVATVLKGRKQNGTALAELVRKLADCEINAEPLVIPVDGRDLAIQLASVADKCSANLVVMGAYGRGIARELRQIPTSGWRMPVQNTSVAPSSRS